MLDPSFLVGEVGFEPTKSSTTDLQSAPFGHSGTLPFNGAGRRTRTPDLLITNQLLYRLSYTSDFPRAQKALYYTTMSGFLCQRKNAWDLVNNPIAKKTARNRQCIGKHSEIEA